MVLLKPFKNYQKKMENNLEVQKINAQNEITARYNFLLNEQPNLQNVPPQRFITNITGGCVASILPIGLDIQDPSDDVETVVYLVVAAFFFGTIATKILSDFINERQKRKVLVANLQMATNWAKPIFVLPYDRFDTTVEQRAKELHTLLNDEKCVNLLHIELQNVEISFDYSIQYGFNKGEIFKTEAGLPIIALYPQLFSLRGAFDDALWLEFQAEAVRIALELDNTFAKQWFTLESKTYRAVAGGQLSV